MDTATGHTPWQVPTLQDFESTYIPEEMLQTPPAPESEALPKRRPYTRAEWVTIRPVFTQLYIDRDMILRDVIQHLNTEHDFYPTGQMCKKRIAAWGLSKNTKAAEKERALEELHRGASPTTILERIPERKLSRYQKSRSNRTACAARPNKVVKPSSRRPVSTTHHDMESSWYTKNVLQIAVSVHPSPTRSLALPGAFADTDLFLRAAREVMLVQAMQTEQVQSSSCVRLYNLLMNGMVLWRKNASAAACRNFSEAADMITANLRRGIVLDVLLFYLSPSVWMSGCQAMYQAFARFLSGVTTKCLRRQHPMTTVVLRLHSKGIDDDEQLRMWDCIVDHFVEPKQHVDRWWYLVRLRWQYCRGIGRYDLAKRYCQEARAVARTSRHHDIYKEIELRRELGFSHLLQGDNATANEHFRGCLELGQVNLELFWQEASSALLGLALVYKRSDEVSRALKARERAFRLAVEYGGRGHARTIDALAALLRFCERKGLYVESDRIKKEYAESFNDLQEITDGMWNIKLGDNAPQEGTNVGFAAVDQMKWTTQSNLDLHGDPLPVGSSNFSLVLDPNWKKRNLIATSSIPTVTPTNTTPTITNRRTTMPLPIGQPQTTTRCRTSILLPTGPP